MKVSRRFLRASRRGGMADRRLAAAFVRATTAKSDGFCFARALIASKRIGTRRLNRKFQGARIRIISSHGGRATAGGGDRPERYEEVFRFYKLAKRAEWQVRDLPWEDRPPIPELRGLAGAAQARRRDVWRSVITQQLQADELAVEMSAQLFSLAPHHEAKLYYSTMVQDESRHTEAWLQLIDEAGGTAERDPHLDKMARISIEADTLEEKVFLMQVFFERLIIPKFKLIAKATPGTVLEDLCLRLAIDDGIHHGAGMAYERVLLERASRRRRTGSSGRPTAAAGVRRARVLASARAGLDGERDADGRHRAAPRRARGRNPDGAVARPRRGRDPDAAPRRVAARARRPVRRRRPAVDARTRPRLS